MVFYYIIISIVDRDVRMVDKVIGCILEERWSVLVYKRQTHMERG